MVEPEERSKILQMIRSGNLDLVTCGLALWEGFIQPEEKKIFQKDFELMFRCSVVWSGYEIENINEIINERMGHFAHKIYILGWFLEVLRESFQISFENLTEFCFSGEKTDGLGKLLLQLKNLEILRLEKCRLISFPKEICELGNLEELNLGWNYLESIPPEIKKLQKLQRLCLSDNRIIKLSEEIGELIGLKELLLDNNKLSYLPDAIGELSNLEHLSINDNYDMGQWLPDCIYELRKLKYLELDTDKKFNPFEIAEDIEICCHGLDTTYWIDLEEYKQEWWAEGEDEEPELV